MRDRPHLGEPTMQPAPVSGCLQPESTLVSRQITRDKNQEKEA
jgi:hypothetical protein